MSKKIYVGNLPFSVDLAKLKELFSGYGKIEEAIVMANKYTGRSRGFGFVTFENEADAEKAIAEMNKKTIEGREISVKEARPLEKREEKSREESKTEEKPAQEFKTEEGEEKQE